jgi:hypothetical protein
MGTDILVRTPITGKRRNARNHIAVLMELVLKIYLTTKRKM